MHKARVRVQLWQVVLLVQGLIRGLAVVPMQVLVTALVDFRV